MRLDKRALRRYATALVELMPTGSEPIAAPLIVDTVRFGASQIVEAARDSREWDAFRDGLSDEHAREFDVFRSSLIQRLESSQMPGWIWIQSSSARHHGPLSLTTAPEEASLD